MIAAIITSFDNGPLLRQQLPILRRELEPWEHAIVVVNNGSRDETRAILERQRDVFAIHRENLGAGPGRNAGLDVFPDADFFFLLDGGILPMVNSVSVLRDYLERNPTTDVIAPPWENFETDRSKVTRRLPHLDLASIYRRWDLSMTAYCLARRRAFAPHRFSEEGPFGEPGWGVDDNEMAARWWRAGIVVEVFGNGRPFRRASGSFQRLFDETGIWPNQYGSVYEKRFVLYQQLYPDHWDNGIEQTLVVPSNGDWRAAARLIKRYRDTVDNRHKEIILVADGAPETHEFVYRHALRQHGGTTTVAADGTIIHRDATNETLWCGNFRVAASLAAARAMSFQQDDVLVGDPARQTWTRA